MNQLIYFALLLFLFTSLGCSETNNAPQLQKGSILISGQVNNMGNNTKTIRFAAGSIVDDIEHTAIIDSLGNFKLEIELYHPQNIQCFFMGRVIKLFLAPSDHIHLELDAENFKREQFPDYKISGTAPNIGISMEIQEYRKYRGARSFHPKGKHKSINEYLLLLQDEMAAEDSILKAFAKENKVSGAFMDWAHQDMVYSTSNYLLNYRYDYSMKGDLYNQSLFPINDKALSSSSYPLHLYHYAIHTGIWQDSTTVKLWQAGEQQKAFQACMEQILNKVESGLSRDIMCYKLLTSLMNESYEVYKLLASNKKAYISNPLLITVLDEKEHRYKKQTDLDISFLDPETKEEKAISGNFWQSLKDKYQGKIVYVDIWATWCGPCRAEIPHAIELHDYFKNKDVAFVNLCLASNKSEWEKMILNNNIKGDHYFFDKSQTQLLRNKLKFKGYPSYLIIDKQGHLVNKDAQRPSSGEAIKQELNDWLENDRQ